MRISHPKVLAGIVVAGLALAAIAGSAFYASVRAESHELSPPSEETSLPEPGPEPAPEPAPAPTEEPTPTPEPSSLPFDFPIAELGACGGVDACRAYCDDLANKDACLAFGAEHGLITREEAELAEELPSTGPGDCASADACQRYCDDPAHQAECADFAVAHGIISADEAEKVRILATTGGPDGCSSPEACEAFCRDPAHQEACLQFAQDHGLISKEEVREFEEQAEVLEKVKTGPGGCASEAACRSYCEDPAHLDECLAFAEEQGFVSPDEAHRIRKAGFTTGPGGCRGEEACRAYCEQPGNQLACIDWAVENGFMTAAEAAIARKMAGKTGPGGCQGQACREYCEDPAHAESCLEFAATEGLIPPEEIARARKFIKITAEGGPGGCQGIQCKTYCQDPAHQDDCFAFAEQHDLIPPEAKKDYEVGKKIRQKVAESGGPGGCRTDDECRAYCTDPGRVEECVAFGAAHGGLPEAEVRRMLKEFAEGRFEAHGDFGPPEEFRRFEEGARRRFEEFRQLEVGFRGGPPTGFPGAPGAFPGAPGAFPGGPPGGPGFVGPGGCTAPAECIKYCTEHREECFSFGPPGAPGVRPPEGGLPPGFGVPELRGDLLQRAPGETRAAASATLAFTKQSGGFYRLVARASRGVREFSLGLAGGSNYGGGINGCPHEFVNENGSFKDSDFPFTSVTVTDCDGITHQVTLPPPYGAGGAPGATPPGFQIPPEFQPPAGSQLPPPGLTPRPCPLMPTVEQCPPGQFKVVAFSSPECGTYYSCAPEGTTGGGFEDPAVQCTLKGGRWDGFTCQLGSVPPPPPPSGDPATECASHGGTWDGAICRFPTSPEHRGLLLQQGAANLLRGLWGLLGF